MRDFRWITSKLWITQTWKWPLPPLPIWEPNTQSAISTLMKTLYHYKIHSHKTERIRPYTIRAWVVAILFRVWLPHLSEGCAFLTLQACHLTRVKIKIWCQSLWSKSPFKLKPNNNSIIGTRIVVNFLFRWKPINQFHKGTKKGLMSRIIRPSIADLKWCIE